MCQIDVLRDKYLTISGERIIKSFQKYIEIQERNKELKQQKLNEKETKNAELIAAIEEHKIKLNQINEELECRTNELSILETEINKFEKQKKEILHENREVQLKCNNLKTSKPCPKDQQILDDGRKKLKYYRQLTRIKWDYTREDVVNGYVTDKASYIKHFSFKPNNTKLSDLLWEEIQLSTNTTINGEETHKENIVQN